ncbi:hypothetical protein ACIQCJ_01015 [Streptomyces sp. NPDC093221]|uniref:hypothetical protein n=1 Tax=Streptomyces sp. NPDC093221 TaxID=3366032 RepID=UPI00380B65FD
MAEAKMYYWTLAVLSPDEMVLAKNQETDLRPDYSLALAVLGRFREYENQRRNDMPELFPAEENEKPTVSSEWELVRSVSMSMVHPHEADGLDCLTSLIENYLISSEMRAVAALVASVSLADSDRFDDAVSLCRATLERDDELPLLTQAALHAQIGLRTAELGDYVASAHAYERAVEISSASLPLYEIEDSSLEVKEFLTGVVESLRSRFLNAFPQIAAAMAAASMGQVSRSSTSNRSPRTATYSLDAPLAGAVAPLLKEQFEEKVRDRGQISSSRTLFFDDAIARVLHANWLRSQLLANWFEARNSHGILGRERVMRQVDPQYRGWVLRDGLNLLRRSGDSDSYEQSLRLLREEGPLQILADELQESIRRAPRHVTKEDLIVFKIAAPLITPHNADVICRTLLSSANSGQQFVPGGWHSMREATWDAISALAASASDTDYLSGRIRSLYKDANAVVLQNMLPAVGNMSWRLVSESEKATWASELLGDVSDEHEDLRDTILFELALQGHLPSLHFFRETDTNSSSLNRSALILELAEKGFPDVVVGKEQSISSRSSIAIRDTIDKARKGAYSFGGVNPGVIGSALSLLAPHADNWEAVCELLRNPATASHQKDPVLDYLARNIDRIPAEVRDRLTSEPELLSSTQRFFMESTTSSEKPSGARLRFLCIATSISASDAMRDFLSLFSSSETPLRIEGVRSAPAVSMVVGNELVLGSLLGVPSSAHVRIRSAVAESLVYFADQNTSVGKHAVKALGEGLEMDGTAIPYGVLRGLNIHGLPRSISAQQELRAYLFRASKQSFLPSVRREAARMLKDFSWNLPSEE